MHCIGPNKFCFIYMISYIPVNPSLHRSKKCSTFKANYLGRDALPLRNLSPTLYSSILSYKIVQLNAKSKKLSCSPFDSLLHEACTGACEVAFLDDPDVFQ
jgi:hypothetical protein